MQIRAAQLPNLHKRQRRQLMIFNARPVTTASQPTRDEGARARVNGTLILITAAMGS